MLSQEALQKILGIEEKVHLSAEEMADRLNITFVPEEGQRVTPAMREFRAILERELRDLKANIVPFTEALETVPVQKLALRLTRAAFGDALWLFQSITGEDQYRPFLGPLGWRQIIRRRIFKQGIAVVILGEFPAGALPMERIRSFKDNSIITILDFPRHIHSESAFHEHFDTAMGMFARHMTNIVLAVGETQWLLYNFNASHPIYHHTADLRNILLTALIPKIVAPIRPHTFAEFIHDTRGFNPHDQFHQPFVQDLVFGAGLFGKTALYPPMKKIDDLPFRTAFHRFIGKLHLDNRSGMSFGFLARQLPVELSPLLPFEGARRRFGRAIEDERDFFAIRDDLYVIVEIPRGRHFVLKVPDVWVLTQRSGSDKTRVNPDTDLVKIGLKNGRMHIAAPRGFVLRPDYKPSFDTKVILAHAVGNALIASFMMGLNSGQSFATELEEKGMALAHWHGYLHPKMVPNGWEVHGLSNPHVSCSSPQSAIYALGGKLNAFRSTLERGEIFTGDIHIEPHHGTNMSYPSVRALAEFFLANPRASMLGNKYLYAYDKIET